MRKLVLSMFTSLDGSIAGPNGEFIPPNGAMTWSGTGRGMPWIGRGTCSTAASISSSTRPSGSRRRLTQSSPAAGIAHAGAMNRLPKTVFSTTLHGDPGWNGTVVGGDLDQAVARLKQEGGGDLFMFGGAGIAPSSPRET